MYQQLLQAGQAFYRATTTALINLVYPPRCVGCGRLLDAWFCPHCVATIWPPDLSIPIDGIDDYVAVGAHRDALRQAIHALKYENLPQVANDLGFLLAKSILQKDWQFDTLIAVPLHKDRQQKRGYNQAIELAQVAATHLECAILPNALYRTLATTPQVGKNLHERQDNVKDAFELHPDYAPQVQNHRIILIDDVCTTGATLVACADVLRRAGVRHIYAATISRADFKTSMSFA